MTRPAFDVFCRVIDNLGDAGVCWRLAAQLAAAGHAVRLWIDDLAPLARILPEIDASSTDQTMAGVRVLPWAGAETALPPADGVVVEAFACTPPAAYLSAMAGRGCLWINLEYLSAEDWVRGCHGLPSPQANGVPKYFFFPGFAPGTGGLLREPGLIARRDAARMISRRHRLHALTGRDFGDLADEARVVLLFCYPDAPLAGLRRALATDPRPTLLLAPGALPDGLADEDSLHVQAVPFVPQQRFDELLWCCDLNLVRGEDSLVRALWAGTPLLWHIYPQADDAHLDKLEAWLALAALPPAAADAVRAWNGHDDAACAQALVEALAAPRFEAWSQRSRQWSDALSAHTDLAQNLLAFCMRCRQTS
ncbi:elongation factor P maturation arginine rhamnosyltransferase EarP [Castellaniella sp. GW247-6E4]|uniref:elongation factor P maturation arginine rhamnosyltransferase EarP n=1 Tax=Castellaniella sp. GW247-6E4 TaxID=3140380 RepID=UPI00331609E5